ncbi:DUF2726 domain-containing protein [Acuticoccus sediminis]|uniref:DUF2726 domain-containing protein n=1 Tax=Acuticoccus sediminis TaxID=2184697 RepID=UPI0013915DC1|nr:DUF2726 domain-containing protein [Acuticoccus sediminis]
MLSTPELIAAGAALAAAVALLVVLLARRPRYVRRPLLSPAEKRFYRVLLAVAGKRAIVVTKVRLADLITVKARKRLFWRAFHQIAQKHIDFVLLDPQTLEPICAVELDDRSHELRERRQRDRFVDRAMRRAGLPLHHVPVRRTYDKAEIGRLIGLLAP